MRTTESFTAILYVDFCVPLLPFNAELLKGNAMLIRACGTDQDGSILRSKEYLLFGNGMATLAMWPQHPFMFETQEQYVVTVTEKQDRRGVRYWEIQSRRDQTTDGVEWVFCVATEEPTSKMGHEVKVLVQSEGNARQFFYLRRRSTL